MLGRGLVMSVLIVALAGATNAEEFANVGSSGSTLLRFPADARGEAMGLATTVNPQGATASWWNPASLPAGRGLEVSFTTWDHPFDDLSWEPLALRVSLDHVTFSAFWGRYRVGPLLVRTAYEPDGDGEMMEFHQDLYQVGVSVDLLSLWGFEHDAAVWMVGTNLRYIDLNDVFDAWDADLGSSLAWTLSEEESGWLRWHATAMVRNLTKGNLGDGVTTEADLPRYYHLGTGIEAGLGGLWRGERVVQASVSYALQRDPEDDLYNYDSEHFGMEVTLGGIASLRAGHRSRGFFPSSEWSWGAGLRYQSDWRWGLRGAVDYATYEQDWWSGPETLHHWTMTLGFDLPPG